MRNKIIEKHYRENYDSLVKRIRARIRDLHTSEDVVQEAYSRAIRYFRTYDPSVKDFDAWFNTILNNSLKKIKNEERDRGISRNVDEQYDEGYFIPASSLTREVVEAITHMEDERAKTILLMYYFYGFKTRDISEYLSLGHSNVRMIISRYKTKLGQEYA